MFATLCSNPLPTKASSGHHSTTSFAASPLVRVAIHSARHTSMLHSTARANSCPPLAAFFAATIVCTYLPPGVPGSSVPPACTSSPNSTEPARLPASEVSHTRPRSTQPVRRSNSPYSIDGGGGEPLGTDVESC